MRLKAVSLRFYRNPSIPCLVSSYKLIHQPTISQHLSQARVLHISSPHPWRFSYTLRNQQQYHSQLNMTEHNTHQLKDLDGLNGTTGTPPAPRPHHEQNAWSGPGPAAFDFRSKYSHHSKLKPNINITQATSSLNQPPPCSVPSKIPPS